MSTALLLSLLIHALLLSLSLGGQGAGLPGLDLPWRERRLGADDLRVTLVARPLSPVTELTEAIEAPVATDPAAAPFEEAPIAVPAAAPSVIALARSELSTWAVPVVPALPVAAALPASSASSVEIAQPPPKQLDLELKERAQQLADAQAKEVKDRLAQQLASQRLVAEEAARQDAERLEVAARQETARLEAARQEAARQEAARQEAARLAAARLLAERQVAEEQQAARQETARQELAKQEAARQETAKLEAAKLESAKQDAAKQDAARLAKAQLSAERAEQEAKREAAKRAIGRQLDEEAAKRDAAARQASPALSPGASTARRGRLFGRTDPNAELLLYAELWSRKIELNQTFDMIREAAKQRHTQPLVTVAVRSDGSVESVSFVRSSGVAEIDEGIRRILQSQAPFPPFHPALAREFDVIEIRRSWSFDTAIRLY